MTNGDVRDWLGYTATAAFPAATIPCATTASSRPTACDLRCCCLPVSACRHAIAVRLQARMATRHGPVTSGDYHVTIFVHLRCCCPRTGRVPLRRVRMLLVRATGMSGASSEDGGALRCVQRCCPHVHVTEHQVGSRVNGPCSAGLARALGPVNHPIWCRR